MARLGKGLQDEANRPGGGGLITQVLASKLSKIYEQLVAN